MDTASNSQLSATSNLVSSIEDNNLRDYLQEAERCLTAQAYRAAVVLGWCATVYHLYRIVEANGLDLFRKSYNAKHRGDYEIKKNDDLERIRFKVRDSDLLEICFRDLGLLSTDEHYRLRQFLDWRNKSAHPTGQYPRPGDVQWLFDEVMRPFLSRPVDLENFPVEMIRPYYDPEAEDPVELEDFQAELIVDRVHPDNHMALMSELLQAYLSPDHIKVHGNVAKLIRYLARRLDHTKRTQANRRLARFLARPSQRSNEPVREVIFWPELKHNSPEDQQTIIRYFIVEFTELIDAGQYTSDDIAGLEKALQHTGAEHQALIVQELVGAFQRCIGARRLTHDDLSVLKVLQTSAEGQNRERCNWLLAEAEKGAENAAEY